MRRNGQLLTCDVCGAETFRLSAGDGEADGGFTRWNEFESAPEGWSSRTREVDGKHKVVDLCPACSVLIEKKVEDAWRELEVERAAGVQAGVQAQGRP